MLKRLPLLLLFIFLFSPFFEARAINLPEPTYEFYVADFAGVLSSETKDFITNSGEHLFAHTSAQVVVVTVSSLQGEEAKDYARELGRKWQVGGKEMNNGLVILLAPNERKIAVQVATGLEGKINDSKAGRFIREYATPEFKNKNWDEGIKNLFSHLTSEIYFEYGKSPSDNIGYKRPNPPKKRYTLEILALVLFLTLYFSGVVYAKRKYKGPLRYCFFTGLIDFAGVNFNSKSSSGGGGGSGFDGGGSSGDF